MKFETPFKLKSSDKRLTNKTVEYGKLGERKSMKSIKSGLTTHESVASMKDKQRAMSLVSAANKMLEERQRQVRAVHEGYRSSKVFEHTIGDIMRVLDHKVPLRNPHSIIDNH